MTLMQRGHLNKQFHNGRIVRYVSMEILQGSDGLGAKMTKQIQFVGVVFKVTLFIMLLDQCSATGIPRHTGVPILRARCALNS
jgi:hypothetical protein